MLNLSPVAEKHFPIIQLGGVAQSLYPGTSVQQLDALVDLLMNFDAYTRQRAPVAPLVEPAAAPGPSEKPE